MLMSETTPETAPATGAAPEQAAPKPTETVDYWKAKSRENESRAKANAEAATRLKELEDREKTESQRLTERIEAAEREAAPLRTAQVRSQFILDKIAELETVEQIRAFVGVADRLRGDTLDELAADAEILLPRILPAAVQDPTRPGARRPVSALTPGASAAPVADPGPGAPRIASALADAMK